MLSGSHGHRCTRGKGDETATPGKISKNKNEIKVIKAKIRDPPGNFSGKPPPR
jgi:hypothetical protein